jgi:hypothetical protein
MTKKGGLRGISPCAVVTGSNPGGRTKNSLLWKNQPENGRLDFQSLETSWTTGK